VNAESRNNTGAGTRNPVDDGRTKRLCVAARRLLTKNARGSSARFAFRGSTQLIPCSRAMLQFMLQWCATAGISSVNPTFGY
jgi:hypothetical protein